MQQTRVLLVAGVALAWQSTAHAGIPAWCKGEDSKQGQGGSWETEYPQRQDDVSQVREILEWSCNSAEEASRPKVEKARAELSKRLYMTDADWSDALEWMKGQGFSSSADDYNVAANSFATLSPMDQYLVIKKGMRSDYGGADELYLADALEQNLTEAGRFAFLESCVSNHHEASVVGGGGPEPSYWAICLGDIAKFDPAKFATEVRGDSSHPPKERFSLHLRLGAVMDKVQEWTDLGKKMIKKDDAYGKLFDVAAKGRAEWEKTIGTQKDLLALVQQVDSATYFHSKKQYAGCNEKAEKALADAVSKIPAKTFTGLHDNDDGIDGFAHDAAPKILSFPEANVAAIAFVLCEPDRAWSYPLRATLQDQPGFRGPRSAAYSAIASQKFELDDTAAKEIKIERTGSRPYGTSVGMVRSWGGVAASIKPGKDKNTGEEGVTISQPKASITTEDCVKSHSTNKLVDWDTAGRPVYESICDKTSMVKHDTTPGDLTVTKQTAAFVKTGMRFSAIFPHDKGLADVFAVWPSKTAKLPSMVLGGTVK
jgi:hypothetical protein